MFMANIGVNVVCIKAQNGWLTHGQRTFAHNCPRICYVSRNYACTIYLLVVIPNVLILHQYLPSPVSIIYHRFDHFFGTATNHAEPFWTIIIHQYLGKQSAPCRCLQPSSSGWFMLLRITAVLLQVDRSQGITCHWPSSKQTFTTN